MSSPTILNVTPYVMAPGSTGDIVFAGAGFVSGVVPSFSGTGITVNSVIFTNANAITVNLTIAGGATVAAHDVTVTNPDAGTFTATGIFTTGTISLPAVTSVSPASVAQGATSVPLNIVGTGFDYPVGVSFTGTGVTVSSGSINWISSTEVAVSVDVDIAAPIATAEVVVNNTDTGSASTAFSVTVFVPISTPVITSISPTSMTQGTTDDVTLTGTGFVDGAYADVDDADALGVVTNSNTFVSSTEMTVNITVPSDATPGVTDAALFNPDTGSFDLLACFTVNLGAQPTNTVLPVITGSAVVGDVLSGDDGTWTGDTPMTFAYQWANVSGDAFIGGATASTYTVQSSDVGHQLAFEVTATNDVATGLTAQSLSTAVVTDVHVSAVSPTSLAQGATGDITITGTGFVSGAVASFSGSGITVNSTTFGSSTSLTANITIAGGATTTIRSVTVTNPDATTATAVAVFTVTSGGGGGGGALAITSTSPTSQTQGDSANVTIHGSGFVSGAVASFSGSGVTVSSTTFTNSTQLVAFVVISGSAALGTRGLTVTNPDATTATITFTIEAGGGGGGGGSGVAITELSPASFDQGTSGSFDVTGTGFVSGITGAFAGSNITINSVTFNSSTSLTINVTVAADAGVSENDLTVTNPDSTGATGSIATTIPSAFSLSAWRWVLSDTTVPESYTMEINPNAGGSLPLQKNVTIYQLTADDAEMVLYEGSDAPQVVEVSGTLLTEAQYNHMVYWYSKRRAIQLTDDLDRTLWVYFTVWTPTRKWSVQYPWRHDWSASFYVVGQQAVNAL